MVALEKFHVEMYELYGNVRPKRIKMFFFVDPTNPFSVLGYFFLIIFETVHFIL